MSTTRTAKRHPAEDPLQEQMDTTERLARLVCGDNDPQFILVFQSLANVLDGFASQPAVESANQARSILRQTAEPMVARGRRGLGMAGEEAAPQEISIFSDPVFLENAKQLIPDRRRIVGGIPTSDYPDCVAVGTDTGWCCTGTLVSPNVVVTAGHCVKGGCASRVFLGEDVEAQQAGTVISVRQAVSHPGYNPQSETNDIAVLILSNDADSEPRAIASGEALNAATSVRLAGYGNTDVYSSGGYGKRRMVDVPLASADPRYGADPDTEFVAGAPFLDRDSCNGDSGGPAFVQFGRKWYLAGATSRGTRTANPIRKCGDGGIYTRVGVFDDWIRSVPGGHWL
jgi:secreted trypsin-like serine protease